MTPHISNHFSQRLPSAIRQAQIIFSQRKDKDLIHVVNLAIGNVSLPMHPAMQKRMKNLGDANQQFLDGIVKYTPSVGTDDARNAMLNIIGSEGIDVSHLNSMITDGGSQAMELMMLGVCGPSSNRPLMLLDPAYTNYIEFGKRLSIPIVSSERKISDDGSFTPLDFNAINNLIEQCNPASLLVIPSDNPTGQFINQSDLNELAKICVKNNIWFVSDEAYRQLYYGDDTSSSIWNISEIDAPGIIGSRISIESASKVWNACGLRIGGLVTDNVEFHTKSVSEYTANLCANAIGQEIFGVLAYESHESLQSWYKTQRDYYRSIMLPLRSELQKQLPDLIITNPEAAIYLIIDFRNMCDNNFDSGDFVQYCAEMGTIKIDNNLFTLLLAPMSGFYSDPEKGRTQLRLAMVEPKHLIKKVPKLLFELYNNYCNK